MMEEKVTRNGTSSPSSEDSDEPVEKLAVIGNPVPVASPKRANGVGKKQRENMSEVERSIYDEAVIACSIEALSN